VILDQNAALVVIDVQDGFKDPVWGKRNNPGAEAAIARLLEGWRKSGRPVYHVRHLSTSPSSPLRPGQPGVELMAEAKPLPGETVISKNVNSAFIGTDLEARLRRAGHTSLVMAGYCTDHCVSTSARMAANLGFEVTLAEDACVTFDRKGFDGKIYPADEVHRVALASLLGEFCAVATSKDLLADLERR
jgi:nicotinamidase-related amidase